MRYRGTNSGGEGGGGGAAQSGSRTEAEAGGGMAIMVPDGVVPSALVDFLVGVGVRRSEARENPSESS